MPITRSLARLHAVKTLLFSTSERMGTTSPERVLKNFIEVLKSASPQFKLAIALLTPWALLITAISKYAWLAKWFSTIRNYVSDWLYASVSIPSSHPLNRQVLAYMVEHGLGKNARTLALTTPGLSLANYQDIERAIYGSGAYDTYGRRVPSSHNSHKYKDDDPDKKSLSYVPEVGKYSFWWKWHRMTFERKVNMHEEYDSKGKVKYRQMTTGNETIVISVTSPFSGAKPIQDFLQHIKAAPAKDRSTTIYRPNIANINWDQGITRPSRNLNAVTLDSKVKDDLVKDIETYLSPATRKYYANRGIPYRRGLLFYGNPGCGKTSFTNALAGHFGLNVYMFSLSTNELSDSILELLFEQLPSRCIVLLEDIDSAGLKRESMRTQPAKKKRRHDRQKYYNEYGDRIYDMEEEEEVKGGVTLSGLLNVLDGIHSKEGMLTIMTSNSPDTLDPALVRPGRIDRKVLFGYCSNEVLIKLFRHIFEKAPEELVEGESVGSKSHDVAAMAEDFANRIPADKLTPAEVQGFLLVHRDDPVAAVDEVAEWAEKTIERKAAGANVDTFASETQPGPEGEADIDSHDSAVDLSEVKDNASDSYSSRSSNDSEEFREFKNYKKLARASNYGHVQLNSSYIPPLSTSIPPPPPPVFPPNMPLAPVSVRVPMQGIPMPPMPPMSRSTSSHKSGAWMASAGKKLKTKKSKKKRLDGMRV
jgi:chaperone BCS1